MPEVQVIDVIAALEVDNVDDLMTTEAVTCKTQDLVVGTMAPMGSRQIPHLPVADGKTLIGNDAANALLSVTQTLSAYRILPIAYSW